MDSLFISSMQIASRTKEHYTFVASHQSFDSSRRMVEQSEWQLDDFRANPVVTWNHSEVLRTDELPIGRATAITQHPEQLSATVTFANTPRAQEIRQLVDEDVIRAMSATWTVAASNIEPIQENGKLVGFRHRYPRLKALSLVTIPDQAKALRTAGLALWVPQPDAHYLANQIQSAFQEALHGN